MPATTAVLSTAAALSHLGDSFYKIPLGNKKNPKQTKKKWTSSKKACQSHHHFHQRQSYFYL